MQKDKKQTKPEKTAPNEADKLLVEYRNNRICYVGEYPDFPILETLFLKSGRITEADIKKLTDQELTALNYAINNKLYYLWGKDRDFLTEKIKDIISEDSKLNKWSIDHINIKAALSDFVIDCNRMPSLLELTGRTGTSAETIRKHINEYESHGNYTEQQALFKILGEKILAKVAKYAIEGDVKAARLYFEVVNGTMSRQPVNNNTFNTQNNYLQVNGKIISQQAILNLPPEQQEQLERIFALNP